VNINFEDRYLTLAALIDLLPEDQRDSAVIYRVKPMDLFDAFRRKKYVQKRYVAVKKDGCSICSCLQSINYGILCRHQLAVMNKFRNEVGFNICQINDHWILPDKRDECGSWIYCSHESEGESPQL
jgi:hypothetical protein